MVGYQHRRSAVVAEKLGNGGDILTQNEDFVCATDLGDNFGGESDRGERG